MKLINESSPIERSALVSENSFTIKASGKAFKILSNTLYSDKITAVIRELCNNAYDSHVAVGKKEVPFDVYLPTTFDPTFTVKDSGLGLSYDDAVNLYSTYFDSTKTHSNDFNGALGLGSKSPFSYSDSFTVKSIFNGVKYLFTAYIKEDGCPSIALMLTEKTDDHNGLEVSMSVKHSDISDFVHKASKVLSNFEVTPNVHNVSNFTLRKRVKTEEFVNGYFYVQEGYSPRPIAVMSNVEYPIDPTFSNELDPLQKHLLSSNICLEFENGELDFAPSREALSYDKTTKQKLLQRLTALKEEMCSTLQKNIVSATSIWDVKIQIHRHAGGRSSIATFYRKAIENGAISVNVNVNGHIVSVDDYIINIRIPSNVKLSFMEQSSKRKILTKDEHETLAIVPSDDMVFVVSDVKNSTSRINYYFTNNLKYKRAYIFTPDVNVKPPVTRLIKSAEELVDYMKKQTGNPDIILASQLQAPPKAKVDKGKMDCLCYTLKHGQYKSVPQIFSHAFNKRVMIDLNDTSIHYYVELNGFKIKNGLDEINYENFGNMIRAYLHSIPNDVVNVYGIRSSSVIKNVKQMNNWVNLFDKIKNDIKSVYNENLDFIKMNNFLSKTDYNYNYDNDAFILLRMNMINLLKEVNNDRVKKFLTDYKTLMDEIYTRKSQINKTDMNNFQRLIMFFKIKETSINDDKSISFMIDKFTKELEEFSNRYNLLKYMKIDGISYMSDEDRVPLVTSVECYFDAIDSKKEI